MKFNTVRWGLGLILISLLSACQLNPKTPRQQGLNSRFNDEQPAVSGDGRWLALISNRAKKRQILLYDLQEKKFVPLPGLNLGEDLPDSPSLSYTGRYLVYLFSLQGRRQIALYDRVTQRSELINPNYFNWIRNPQISPDGRYIVFESARRGQWNIEVLDRGPQIELDVPDGTPVR